MGYVAVKPPLALFSGNSMKSKKKKSLDHFKNLKICDGLKIRASNWTQAFPFYTRTTQLSETKKNWTIPRWPALRNSSI
jgi:hypothetical protein